MDEAAALGQVQFVGTDHEGCDLFVIADPDERSLDEVFVMAVSSEKVRNWLHSHLSNESPGTFEITVLRSGEIVFRKEIAEGAYSGIVLAV